MTGGIQTGVSNCARITGDPEVGRGMADSGFVLANAIAFTDPAQWSYSRPTGEWELRVLAAPQSTVCQSPFQFVSKSDTSAFIRIRYQSDLRSGRVTRSCVVISSQQPEPSVKVPSRCTHARP